MSDGRATRKCPDCQGEGTGCGCPECRGTDHGRKKAGSCFLCYGTGIWFLEPSYRELKKHCCRKKGQPVQHFGMYRVVMCRYVRRVSLTPTVDMGAVTCRSCLLWIWKHREAGDLDEKFFKECDKWRHRPRRPSEISYARMIG